MRSKPFEALGKTLDEKIDKKIDEIKDWAWSKVATAFFGALILSVLICSLIVGIPMRALVYRVPVKNRD